MSITDLIARRGWRRLLVAAVTVTVVSACRGAERARSDDRLVIAVPQDGGVLNPYSGSPGFLLDLVYDKLFAPSPYVTEPQPALAERAVQLDSLTWLVTIRSGIRWHDGQPFTADDVRFTYEYYRDGPANRYGHHVSDVPHVAQISLVDSVTVRFVCGYPCPLLARVTMADLPIIPRHVWQGNTQPRSYAELPVGTGPYRLVEHRSDQFYRFTANADYFGGEPLVRELVMPIVGDYSSIFAALRTGEIHAAAQEVPAELKDRLARVDGLAVTPTAPLTIAELRPNYRKFPFDQPTFRAALSLAIDRASIVNTVLLGQGRPGTRGYPHPDSPWTDPETRTPYDPAHSRTLLDELGYVDRDGDGVRELPDGTPLRLSIKVNGGEPLLIRTAELVTRHLADVGMPAEVETLESTAMSQRIQAGAYDLFVSEIGAHGVADPDQFIMSHRTGYLWHRDIPYPAMDSLFVHWRNAATVDARREASYAMQRLFNRQPTSIALYYPDHYWAYRPDAFDGWRESPGYGIVHKWSLLPQPDARAAGS